MRTLMLVASIVVVLSGCKPAPPTTGPAAEPAPAASPSAASTAPEPAPASTSSPAGAAGAGKPAFTGKVWRVQSSTAGEPGSTYAFLADGTLVIDSPHGTPLYGQWSYDGGKLVMTEEGMAYPTDIVALDANTFRIRSHNPGGTVDITLVPAPDAPLPTTPPK
jgi:hypothetical protein